MPFFFGSSRHSGKSKGQSEGTAPKKEELLNQVNHLQSEMTRLQMQLVSMQTSSDYERAKEDLSTQRSHQTLSTRGTTPQNTASSTPRLTEKSSISPQMRALDGYPCGSSVPKDRPPPVSQIFIPTPDPSMGRVHQKSSRCNITSNVVPSRQSHSSENSQMVVKRGTLPTRTEKVVGVRAHQQYERKGVVAQKSHSDLHSTRDATAQRPKTRSWRSFQSTPSRRSKGSKSSSGRVRYRTVRRISSGTAASPTKLIPPLSPPSPRPPIKGRVAVQPPNLLGSERRTPTTTSGDLEYGTRSPAGFHRDSRATRQGKIQVVWPPCRTAEDQNPSLKMKHIVDHRIPEKPSERAQARQVQVASVEKSRNIKPDHESRAVHDKSNPDIERCPDHVPSENPKRYAVKDSFGPRISVDPARVLQTHAISSSKCNNNTLLLSQIRSQDVKLRPAEARPQTTEKNAVKNDGPGWNGLIAAIQGGVALKHVEAAPEVPESEKMPRNMLLRRLQERKRECMRNQKI